MNRREFVKALAGIPLLGLLVKVPKAEKGEYREIDCLTFNGASHRVDSTWDNDFIIDLGYIDVWDSKAGRTLASGPIETEDWLVERYKDESGDWHERVLLGVPPADRYWDKESPPSLSYWNGQEWIRT